VGAALSNAVFFSQQINQFAGGMKEMLATNGAELGVTLKNFESSSEVLKNTLQDMQAGKGLAGTLLRNEQLATNVNTTAANLSLTTSNFSIISSNLNRLGLWRFLWHREIPPKENEKTSKNPAK
jgi:hypothetical protein